MTVRRFVPVAAMLITAGLVLAQPPDSKEPAKKDTPAKKELAKPAAGSLEDTLEKALRNSADIKAAEAKVRDAEAELNKVRHQVLARATALHSDLNLAKRMLALSEETYALLRVGMEAGKIPREKLQEAEAARIKHHGEVEKLEAELKSLRGEFALSQHRGAVRNVAFSPDGRLIAHESVDGSVRLWDANDGSLMSVLPYLEKTAGGAKTPGVQAPMMERIKKLLEQEVEFEIGGETIHRTFQFLLEAAKSDIPLRNLPSDQDVKIHPLKGKLAVGAWMQAIEDSDPNVRIVIRDYGLLLTARDRVPEGALRAQDLWKGNYAELKKPDPKGAEKK